mgnify:FL=1
MKDVNEIVENAKRKSTRKGIPIKYKGQIVRLDPAKVAVASFGVTASLIIAGIASSKLIENVKETKAVVEYQGDINKTWADNGEIYRVNNNRDYAIDYFDIANDILKSGDERDAKLLSFIMSHKASENSDLFQSLAFIEDKSYKNLEEYIIDRGFNSVDEWKNYCKDQILKSSNNGRTM